MSRFSGISGQSPESASVSERVPGAAGACPAESGMSEKRGERGKRGPRGHHGHHGPTGPVGSMGEMGIPGTPGIQGPTGRMGSQGAAGTRGPQGNNGATGPTGDRGFPGSSALLQTKFGRRDADLLNNVDTPLVDLAITTSPGSKLQIVATASVTGTMPAGAQATVFFEVTLEAVPGGLQPIAGGPVRFRTTLQVPASAPAPETIYQDGAVVHQLNGLPAGDYVLHYMARMNTDAVGVDVSVNTSTGNAALFLQETLV